MKDVECNKFYINGCDKMFQNISNENIIENTIEENESSSSIRAKDRVKELFSVQYIVLYSIACMASMVSFNANLAPFGLAIFAAVCGNKAAARNSIHCLFSWDINRFWWGRILNIFANYLNIYCNDINHKAQISR